MLSGVAAATALVLAGALPASAVTYVGKVTTTYYGISDWTFYPDGYYAHVTVHATMGYDYAASAVHIEHLQVMSSAIAYGTYAGPGSWSTDTVCVANEVAVGDAAYV